MNATSTPARVLQVDALISVVLAIENDPELWDQSVFAATGPRDRTRHCFAAMTCALAGRNVRKLLREDSTGGQVIYDTAAALLGLSDTQAEAIFHFNENTDGQHPTVAELKAVIHHVTGVLIR